MDRKAQNTPIFRGKRAIAGLIAACAFLVSWGVGGSHVISVLNPALRHELSLAMHPALDVWVTPPDYVSQKPIIIATPAGILFKDDIVTIPEGSIVSAHLAEQDGDAPTLVVDSDEQPFTADSHGDFAATEKLSAGNTLSITRNGATLATWKINVLRDSPPKISMVEPPSIASGKTLRVAYRATDDFGVEAVFVRVTPSQKFPGSTDQPVDIALPVTKAKEIAHVDFADLTSHPWAGQPVTIRVVATNVEGQTSESEPVQFTLPERSFFHPVARVLIDERKKLLLHPDDEALREEAANVMAGIAHDTPDYHGDHVILMALRAGAVRLILDRSHSTALSVNDLLWQAAIRIEDGDSGQAQQTLHDARQDLARAIRENASPKEISILTARLQEALQAYMSQIFSKESPGRIARSGYQPPASSKVQ